MFHEEYYAENSLKAKNNHLKKVGVLTYSEGGSSRLGQNPNFYQKNKSDGFPNRLNPPDKP